VRFLSNQARLRSERSPRSARGGFDPRDVMDKSALPGTVVPTIAAFLDREFPFEVRAREGESGTRRCCRACDAETCDSRPHSMSSAGPALRPRRARGRRGRAAGRIAPGRWRRGGEARAGAMLIDDRLSTGPGCVVDVGRRVGPARCDVPSSRTSQPDTCTRCAAASSIRPRS
jgi:hypothetical protein